MKRLIIIDPGHGGKDSGAIYSGTLIPTDGRTYYEKAFNLVYATIFKGMAEKQFPEWDVRLTRTDDTFIELHDRTNLTRVYDKVDIFASFHFNGSADMTVHGTETLYYKEEQSKKLAQLVQKELISAMTQLQPRDAKDRGVKDQNVEVLRESRATASILVEFEFITCKKLIELIWASSKASAYQQHMVQAVIWGINNFFQLKAS